MCAKPVVIERGPARSQEARIVPGHLIDQRANMATHRCSGGSMARRLPAEREMRLIRPFEIRLL
jgi:hypothetical protein